MNGNPLRELAADEAATLAATGISMTQVTDTWPVEGRVLFQQACQRLLVAVGPAEPHKTRIR